MKQSEIKKWSICLLYLVLLVLLFYLDVYVIFKIYNYHKHALPIDLEKALKVMFLIMKSCCVILFVLLVGLLLLHRKLIYLRLQLKVMMIITFILELIFVFIHYF